MQSQCIVAAGHIKCFFTSSIDPTASVLLGYVPLQSELWKEDSCDTHRLIMLILSPLISTDWREGSLGSASFIISMFDILHFSTPSALRETLLLVILHPEVICLVIITS